MGAPGAAALLGDSLFMVSSVVSARRRASLTAYTEPARAETEVGFDGIGPADEPAGNGVGV